MKKFEIKEETFEGKVTVLYGKDGSILYLDFTEADMGTDLKKLYKNKIPTMVENVPMLKDLGLIVNEVSIVIPFEKWYAFFDLKRNKEEATRIYNKIDKDSHMEVWLGTKAYLRYCQRNLKWYNKMYPDTFLRNSHWKDDWDKIFH